MQIDNQTAAILLMIGIVLFSAGVVCGAWVTLSIIQKYKEERDRRRYLSGGVMNHHKDR